MKDTYKFVRRAKFEAYGRKKISLKKAKKIKVHKKTS